MPYVQPRIKLAIADDHKLFRKGLISLINMINEDRYLIVFEAENGKDLISKLDKKALPDIVIMDINMPGMDGFETVDWLQSHYPTIHILVVSMMEKEENIVRMLKLGVKGYLSKDIDPKDLENAITAIMSKGFYYTDFITGKLIHSLRNEGKNEDGAGFNELAWNSLNEREREFLKYACTEMTYQEIADLMYLNVKTVDGYRDRIFDKLKVKNRIGLVLYAVRNGLVNINNQ
jgi:two-component system, NarL family, invasion response regulator UvrY